MSAFRRTRRVTAFVRAELTVEVDELGNVLDVVNIEPAGGANLREVARKALARVDGYAEETPSANPADPADYSSRANPADYQTTDYCARCGESPMSGTHMMPGHGHPYVPPTDRSKS